MRGHGGAGVSHRKSGGKPPHSKSAPHLGHPRNRFFSIPTSNAPQFTQACTVVRYFCVGSSRVWEGDEMAYYALLYEVVDKFTERRGPHRTALR